MKTIKIQNIQKLDKSMVLNNILSPKTINKLKSELAKASTVLYVITYLLDGVHNKFFSIVDGNTEYVVKPLSDFPMKLDNPTWYRLDKDRWTLNSESVDIYMFQRLPHSNLIKSFEHETIDKYDEIINNFLENYNFKKGLISERSGLRLYLNTMTPVKPVELYTCLYKGVNHNYEIVIDTLTDRLYINKEHYWYLDDDNAPGSASGDRKVSKSVSNPELVLDYLPTRILKYL